MGVGPGGCGGAACGGGQQEVACGPPSAAGGALTDGKGKQRGGKEEDNRLDLFAISEKFRGPTVKQK